jgi:membrane protein YqaA with SNARE-associated domain
MAHPRGDDRALATLQKELRADVGLAVAAVETAIAPRRFWRREYTALVLVGLVLASIAFVVYVLDVSPAGLRRYGYLGVFLIPFIGSATFVLPMPGLAVIAGGGAFLEPVFGMPPWLVVGLLAGLGETLGELTGYGAGFGGRAALEKRRFLSRLERWMHRQGSVVMFVLAAIPNPIFDLGGVLAGVVRMPLWKFLVAVLLGKVIKSMYVAGAGAAGLHVLQRWFG